MEKIRIFIQLTRLNKPIGFLLLFWPCTWGLTLGYYFNGEAILYLKHIIMFFFGSVLMRGAGCIFNDIVDRNLDKKVQRTKERPIASGKISVLESFIYVIFICLTALLILLQFNWLTIVLGISSMIFAFEPTDFILDNSSNSNLSMSNLSGLPWYLDYDNQTNMYSFKLNGTEYFKPKKIIIEFFFFMLIFIL